MTPRPTSLRTAFRALLFVLAALAATAPAASAQEEETDTLVVPERRVPLEESPDLPEVDEPTSPGGAFLRSLALPGWGHAAIGEYTRGGFYFTAQSATLWMLLRTVQRLGAAEDLRDFRERAVERRLASEGVEDPEEIEEALAEDADVDDARDLVSARDQQFEDWLALAIFLSFLGGADAFVSAHLKDFPEPVQVGIVPVGDRWEIGISVTIPPIR